jgi:hypothetical protein
VVRAFMGTANLRDCDGGVANGIYSLEGKMER